MHDVRDRALAARPDAIRADALADALFVHEECGVDEAHVVRVHLRREGGEVRVEREVWWFDEDSLAWELDDRETFALDRGDGEAVAEALRGLKW